MAPPEQYQGLADKDGFPKLPPGVHQGMKLGALRPTEIAGGMPISPARVTDNTGLPGRYDFTLEYAGAFAAAEALPPVSRDQLDESGPSIFAALERQLGLTLAKTKTTVEVLVIDHAERTPASN